MVKWTKPGDWYLEDRVWVLLILCLCSLPYVISRTALWCQNISFELTHGLIFVEVWGKRSET